MVGSPAPNFRKGGLVFVFVLNVGICLYLLPMIKSY